MTTRLTKAEAAAYLGCSPRTIERYVRQKRLNVAYQRGRTRPIAVFDADAVKAVSAQIGNQADPAQAHCDISPLDDISAIRLPAGTNRPDVGAAVLGVRLPEHYRVRLEQEARSAGITLSAYARRLLMDSLEGNTVALQTAESLQREITETQKSIEQLRADLALISIALLMRGGRCSRLEAQDWATANLGVDPFRDLVEPD
jgi:excisionase family DNA binding protein